MIAIVSKLREAVRERIDKEGTTATAVLEDAQILAFMELKCPQAMCSFYIDHSEEIIALCKEDPELFTEHSLPAGIQLALEKVCMLIEANR